MVVINLYPFRATIEKPDVTFEDAVENIDIGGPSMLRSAAKNWADVTVVCDPADYAQILAETKQRDKQDSERAAAPLRQAADAVVLDTSGYTLEQSVEAILSLVRRKLG